MIAAIRAVAGSPDLVEGPVADPNGFLAQRPVLFSGAGIAHGGEIVGVVKATKQQRGETWIQVQLRRSSEYFENIKKMIQAGQLCFALPSSGAEARAASGAATKSMVMMLKPLDASVGLKTAQAGLSGGRCLYRIVPLEEIPPLVRLRAEGHVAEVRSQLGLFAPVRIQFVAPVAREEEADFSACGDARNVAFVPDERDEDGAYRVCFRSDIDPDLVPEAAAHEVRHIEQLADGGSPNEQDAYSFGAGYARDIARGFRR